MFKDLPKFDFDTVRSEYVDALPEFRRMKEKVTNSLVHIEEVNRSAINNAFSLKADHDYYSQTDAWQEFLASKRYNFKYLAVIVVLLLVFPTNSAGCERIFSATAWLKNERRNRMLDDLLNANLHMKFNRCNFDYSLL